MDVETKSPVTPGAVSIDPGTRLRLLRVALAACLLSQMALCPRLWLSSRSFPTVPAIPGLPDLPDILSLALLCPLILSSILFAMGTRPRVAGFTMFATGAAMVVFDINRLQPWFYQIMLMCLATVIVKDPADSALSLAVCACIVCSLYFWGGVQKANLNFATEIFPWLLSRKLSPAWFLAPTLEASMGFLLLIPRTRWLGIALSVTMHVGLLAVLGPFGHNFNSVVWPWNFWLPLIVVVIFFGNRGQTLPIAWKSAGGRILLFLVMVLPSLNFFGVWDDNLSASLYSGRTRQAFIVLKPEGIPFLSKDVIPFLQSRPDRTGLDLTRWALADVNVPPYPEVWVYQAVARRLARQGMPLSSMELVISEKPPLTSSTTKFVVTPIP